MYRHIIVDSVWTRPTPTIVLLPQSFSKRKFWVFNWNIENSYQQNISDNSPIEIQCNFSQKYHCISNCCIGRDHNHCAGQQWGANHQTTCTNDWIGTLRTFLKRLSNICAQWYANDAWNHCYCTKTERHTVEQMKWFMILWVHPIKKKNRFVS